MFQDGSRVSRIINGRAFTLAVCFALAAFFSATLLFESKKWAPLIWTIVLIAVPIYFALALLAHKSLKKEYKAPYQLRGVILWSRRFAGVVLLLIFLIVTLTAHANNALSFGEAFSITPLLFDSSPSVILEELGKLSYLIDGYTTYLVSQVSIEQPMYLLATLIMRASTAFAVTSLLSLCLLTKSDLKVVFTPIEEKNNEKMKRSVPLGATVSLLVCTILMVSLFCVGDQYFSQAKNSETYKGMEQFVRDQTNITTYTINEESYDTDTIDKKLNQLLSNNQDYATRRTELTNLYESSYSTCENNVDAYLDWYYRSFFDDPLGVASQTAESWLNQGSYKDKQRTEFQSRITNGIDVNIIEADTTSYNQAIYNMQDQLCSNLESMHIYKIPDWLASHNKPFSDYLQTRYLNSSFEIVLPEGNYPDREEYKKAILSSIAESKKTTMDALQVDQ